MDKRIREITTLIEEALQIPRIDPDKDRFTLADKLIYAETVPNGLLTVIYSRQISVGSKEIGFSKGSLKTVIRRIKKTGADAFAMTEPKEFYHQLAIYSLQLYKTI